MKRKSYIFIGILLAVVIAIIFINPKSQKGELQITSPVEKGGFDITVSITGELQAENSEKIKGPFLSRVGIYRMKIADLVPEGTLVDSGDFVAELDKTEITSKVDELNQQLTKVQSQYDKTQLDTALELRGLRDNLVNLKYSLEEAEITLDQSKFESPSTIRQAKISMEKAQRAYKQALENYDLKVEQKQAQMIEVGINLKTQQQKLKKLEDIRDEFTINAPKPGMVIYKKNWNGSKRKVGTEFSSWDPVVATLPDMSVMISRTFVNEIDISKVKVDQEVTIGVDAFPDKEFRGKVIEVANVGEDLPGSDAKVFEVLIRVEGSDTILRPNMTTSNIIKAKHYDDVVFVPLESIHNNDSLTFVYAENSSRPVKQIVEVGESNENEIIIKEGLSKANTVYLTIPENAAKLDFKGQDIYEKIKKKEVEEKKRAEAERLRLENEKKDSAKRKNKPPINTDSSTVFKKK